MKTQNAKLDNKPTVAIILSSVINHTMATHIWQHMKNLETPIDDFRVTSKFLDGAK